MPEAVNHPQINSRDILQPVAVPGGGLMMLARTPYHMSETPTKIGQRVALLGEDNGAVLSKDLGLSDAAIRDLTASGVLAQDPVTSARQNVKS